MKGKKMPEYKKKFFEPEKFFSKQWFKNYGLVLIGSLLVSVGYVFFIIPHNIVPGGVFGVSIIINQLSGLPIGLVSLCINIPVLLLGIKILGGKFGIKTILSMILCSIMIDSLSFIFPDITLTKDILVSSVFGGSIIGSGIALVIMAGATTGGTDIIARIFSIKLRASVSKMLLIVDGAIVLMGILIFMNLDLAPYSIIAIFTISKSIDFVQYGMDMNKAAFIISSEHETIRNYILEKDRGGTYIKGTGLFFKEKEQNIIFTVLNKKSMSDLELFIKKSDPEAFVALMNANDVFGRGFKPFGE